LNQIASELDSEQEQTSTSAGWQLLSDWFNKRGWQLAGFQKATARAFLQGQSGLIHAPTGSGKTLAAIAGPLIEAYATAAASEAFAAPAAEGNLQPTRIKPPSIRIIWITPLRALAQDTFQNLSEVLADILPHWTVMLRTGDSSSAQRASMRKKLPSLLVTTPESLSLLLSYGSTHNQFNSLTTVIVDEWHELLGSKRGVLLQLSLARLRKLANPRIWGLSATIGNLQEAMAVLLADEAGKGQLVHAPDPKHIEVRTIRPASLQRFPWAGHLGLVQLPQVIKAIEQAASTLLFTNTRSQAELWYEAIVKQRLDWLTQVALHHGSLARGVRKKVEDGLRAGIFKCVVCTSSLDLGVDFSPVAQAIQVGSPKGIARLAQRAGRSGHRPGETSKVYCVPTHAFELLEAAAARSALLRHKIESRLPPRLCLDVLVQHLVTLALGPGFRPQELLPEIRNTHAFQQLSDDAWQWALDFIHRGGQALQYYEEFKKVEVIDGLWRVTNRRIGQRHRMAIGTITSDSMMRVSFQRGGSLGTIEESFISRLQPGDAFLFNGRVLELLRVKDMTAWVKANPKARRIVPRWSGGKMPLSTQLAEAMLEQFAQVEEYWQKSESGTERENGDTCPGNQLAAEIVQLMPLLELQKQWSDLPAKNRLLVEQIKTREGYHCFMYPLAGRLVHEGLAALLGHRLTLQQSMTLTMTVNDYGIEFFSKSRFQFEEGTLTAMLSSEDLLSALQASINKSEFAKRQFRENARIAGLIFTGYPGAPKTVKNLQMSSGVLYEVLANYDCDNQLIQQALDDVLQHQMEYSRLQESLLVMTRSEKRLTSPGQLTPLSFPLWAQRVRAQVVSTEKWQDRVTRMINSLEKKAGKVH